MNRTWPSSACVSPWIASTCVAAAALDFGLRQLPEAVVLLQIIAALATCAAAVAISAFAALLLQWSLHVPFRRAWPACTMGAAALLVVTGHLLPPDRSPYDFDPPPNHSVEANRRPAAPLEAGIQFGSSFSAPSAFPAAVAHLDR